MSDVASSSAAAPAVVRESRARRRARALAVVASPNGQIVFALAALAFAGLYPLFTSSPFYLHLGTVILIYVPLAIGQNLITGNSGQVAMGHAAFYGVGAYLVAILSTRYAFGALPAILLAIVAAAAVGLISGLPAIRISGDYLFIVTIGLNLIFADVTTQWIGVTGGPSGLPGIPLPTIFGVTVDGERGFLYLALVAAAIATAVAFAVTRSRFGKAIEALRDDEMAARAIGINPVPIKVGVFVIAAALAGLSGAIFAYQIGFVGPQSFGVFQSLLILEMTIIGGFGSVAGSILGAILLIGVPELLQPVQDYRIGIGGLLVIVLMIVRPEGLLGTLKATTLIKK